MLNTTNFPASEKLPSNNNPDQLCTILSNALSEIDKPSETGHIELNSTVDLPTIQTVSQLASRLIIYGGRNQIWVDSRDIAKEFGRQHKNVLQTLDDLLADGTISRLESKPCFYKKRGREYRCFELNKAGFLKAMPFIGGRKSREGQKYFVDEFLKLEAAFERQSKERATLAYQVARLSGKGSRELLTDEIQKFVDYATTQGSDHANRYYASITKAIYKSKFIVDYQAIEVREFLTTIQLSILSIIELIAAQALVGGMAMKLPYKEIYQMMKNAINSFDVEKTRVLGN